MIKLSKGRWISLKKFGFFGKFFLNFLYVVLFSQVSVLLVILIIPLKKPIYNFLFTTALMFALLIFRFWREGYGESASSRVSIREFISGALPVWIIFAIYRTCAVFLLNIQVSGDGVFSLSLILSGNMNANALRVGEMPQNIAPAFLLSLFINSVLYTLFAYTGYRLGIWRRNTVRKNTLSGNNKDLLFRQKLPFYSCFIPIVNALTLFPWVLSYLVMPEKKLSRLFGKAAVMFIMLLTVRGIRVAFYTAVPQKTAYYLFCFITSYALCVVFSLIAYKDGKNN